MLVVEYLLIALSGFLWLPILVLFIQVVAACFPCRRVLSENVSLRPRIAVLVPAHNEAVVVVATLETLRSQLREGDRLLVVADNCSDDTAALARTTGAEVIERLDTERRGKGYALDFGVRHLAAEPPEVLVIIDADCRVGEGALDLLAHKAALMGRPVQALYLMHAPVEAGLKLRIAEFAWLVKNWVRPIGFHRFGLPCQLMGTGMAFPWQDMTCVELATGHIVEDLKLGLDFCRMGKPPVFLPAARVESWFPANEEGAQTQRTRWEHGHLGVLFNEGPKLLLESVRNGNGALLAMALDLVVPPLALLVLLTTVILVLAFGVALIGGSSLPALLALAAEVLLGSAVMLAWAVHGRKVISLYSLAYVPLYVFCKIPVYLKFVLNRQVEWVRSKRDGT